MKDPDELPSMNDIDLPDQVAQALIDESFSQKTEHTKIVLTNQGR